MIWLLIEAIANPYITRMLIQFKDDNEIVVQC